MGAGAGGTRGAGPADGRSGNREELARAANAPGGRSGARPVPLRAGLGPGEPLPLPPANRPAAPRAAARSGTEVDALCSDLAGAGGPALAGGRPERSELHHAKHGEPAIA